MNGASAVAWERSLAELNSTASEVTEIVSSPFALFPCQDHSQCVDLNR